MDWITGIQSAIDYIEANITEELDYELIARASFSSSYHFQRVFSILCGYTLGEYIRCRRLSLAGAELASGRLRVIDAALKYGYESPDSFTRAFRAFHGLSPSQARGGGASLKSFSRLTIKISLEGGTIMNYRIEDKPDMILTGFKRRFSGDPNDKKDQDHDFAVSTRPYQYILQGMAHDCDTHYEVLTNFGDDGYDFYFAYKLYPWNLESFEEELGAEIASKYEHLRIPAARYMVCETERCRYPVNLVDELRRRAVTQWLPSSGCELADAPEIVVCRWYWKEGDEAVNNSRCCELWLPITEKK